MNTPREGGAALSVNTAVRFRVFTAPACAHCEQVTAWLREHGCAFDEHPITNDVGAFEEWRRLSGGVAVPVTAFGTDLVIGFDPQRLELFVRSCRNSSAVDLPCETFGDGVLPSSTTAPSRPTR